MAAPDQVVTISGLAQLEINLDMLAQEYGPRNAISALRTPMRNALRVAEAQIRNTTPVDTGRLRESVGIRINLPNRRLRNAKHINNDAVLIGRVGWFWRRPSLWNQALAVEFGNRVTKAQPTIRPALDTLAAAAVADFAPALARSIEITAARLGRRAAAGTLRRR